ncbi:MAG: family 1 glycosylhydrolase, partial [bacterium]
SVLKALKERGFKVMLTLHHFTTPLWLANAGGFTNKRSIFYFRRFAERVFQEYHDSVDFWATINEPVIYATCMCSDVLAPDFKAALKPLAELKRLAYYFSTTLKVVFNQIDCHKKVYETFHGLAGKEVLVGIVKNNAYIEPFRQKSFFDKLAVKIAEYWWNIYFLNRVKNHMDFIGLNYYFHHKIKFPWSEKNENKVVSNLGWEVYPEGIYHVLKRLKKYGRPIYITENGVADAGDKVREDFIRDHLYWILLAIKEGVDVRGYFHWSLLDNVEWDKGKSPRFGLIEVNYETMERTIKPSAYYYAEVCKNNGV